MEIKINIYNDCTSEKPSKTYVVRRILFKTAKQLGELQEEANKQEGHEEELTLKMLKAVCPDFKDEDLGGVDPIELGDFMSKVAQAINDVVAGASKN